MQFLDYHCHIDFYSDEEQYNELIAKYDNYLSLPEPVKELWRKIVSAKTTTLLQIAYKTDTISAWNMGLISEEHKEDIRKESNKIFVYLSSKGK